MRKTFGKIHGAMEALGDEVKNLHFWSCHAEVLNVADCFTDLSDVDSLRADSEKAAEWLRKYAAVSELMMSLKETGKKIDVGHDYQSDDGDWTFWIEMGGAK